MVLWVEDDLLEFALGKIFSICTRCYSRLECTWRALMSSILAARRLLVNRFIKVIIQERCDMAEPQSVQSTSRVGGVDMGVPGTGIAVNVCMCSLAASHASEPQRTSAQVRRACQRDVFAFTCPEGAETAPGGRMESSRKLTGQSRPAYYQQAWCFICRVALLRHC